MKHIALADSTANHDLLTVVNLDSRDNCCGEEARPFLGIYEMRE